MMKYIITRTSIINKCNSYGVLHLFFTEKENPCEEASFEKIYDNKGNLCSRYFINIKSIEESDKL